jgi:hypothetical protein
MDMKTFKTLEFAAIFGVIGYFWWTQRQARLRQEAEQRQQREAKPEETANDDTSGQGT